MVEIVSNTTKPTTALKSVNIDIRTTQVTALGCEYPLKVVSRRHGTAGTEAQAPCTGGFGNKRKNGNSKSRSGTGK